jgi:hypothetical protein
LNEHPAFLRWSGVRRFALCAFATIALCGLVATMLQAQISEADKKKRDAFLKAREEMRTVASPTPSDSASSKKGKPKPATKKSKSKSGKSPTPSPTEKAKRAEPADEEEGEDDSATPRATKKKDVSPSPSGKSRKRDAEEDEEPAPQPTVTPRPTAVYEPPAVPRATPTVALPAPTPPPLPADITIEKSGLEQEQGFEPPPPPPPRRGFFARLFGGGGSRNYRYLNRSVIDAIRRAPVQRSRWKFMIVHNSGTRQGNAKAFDYYHKRVKRMQNGMAYHFVVGNGRSSGDGEIEIGDRWRRQINGGHVHSDYLNNISLGICLVGDFNRDQPTRAQLEASEELVKYLRERCGKADGRAIGVRPHREVNPPRWATDCPGDAFPYGWFRRF